MTKIIQWDGTQENLPLPNQPFFYKDEIKNFVWKPCNCKESCQRPVAYKLENGEKDFAMTIRLRGIDQGVVMHTVTAKLGYIEELALTQGNLIKIAMLVNRATDGVPLSGSAFQAFLESKDLSEEEFIVALSKAEKILSAALML
ncbi:MAG: hypothetical protein HYV90_06030 [Candidatus Woesebacteria bacterium]|nr:MAG: hypothetical protein HYV90_06030 [Candidatus Woesebacteria bacterium]